MANKTMADAYGLSVDEMLGKTELHLGRLSAKHAYHTHTTDPRVLDTKIELFVPEVESEFRDGCRSWMQITKIPCARSEWRGDDLLAVATDITKQKLAAIEMQRAKEASEGPPAPRARS